MRILHTSDLHLGAVLAGESLVEDQAVLVEKILGIARGEQAEAVMIAGDVYDHAVSSAQAIALYDRLVSGICLELGIPAFVCAGNHDGAARLAACSSLLAGSGLHVAGSVRDGIKTVSYGDCDFHLLPFFAIDEVRFLYPDEKIKNYPQAMKLLLDTIRARFAPGRKNILLAHCYVAGTQTVESDRSVVVGGSNMVGTDLFEGFDYAALGHLHRAQSPVRSIRYSGSPMKLSFDENGYDKSVTMLDTDRTDICEIAVKLPHDMRVVTGTYAEVLEIAAKDECPDDYMKVVLTDEYAGFGAREALRSYYKNLLVLEGKSYQNMGAASSLTVGETVSLSPEDIVTRFYEETAGEALSEKQKEWFARAVEQVAREEGMQ